MWQTIVPNDLWLREDFLKPQSARELLEMIESSGESQLKPEARDLDGLRAAGVNPTEYRYNIHHNNIRDRVHLVDEIFSQIEQITGRPTRRVNLNALQLFSKSFSPEGFYSLHTESAQAYGDFAFVIFLTSEPGTELVFTSQESAQDYLRDKPVARQRWQQNLEQLHQIGQAPRFIGPLKIKPVANTAVLFRTGSAHYVEPYQPGHEFAGRLSLTGWPYAPDQTIESLRANSMFKKRFEGKPADGL